jgi:hypothetical protein
VCSVLVQATDWTRFLYLAPVFVIGIGLIAAVLILLGRAFADSIRDVKHKNVLWLGALAMLVAVLVLTYLGVNLPKE